MVTRYGTALIGAAILATVATGLAAQPAAPEGSSAAGTAGATPARTLMASCRSDLQTYCAGVERGGGRMLQCLKQHEAKLSPDCKGAIHRIVTTAGENNGGRLKLIPACRADIDSVCAGVEKGAGRIGKCLRENEAKLSKTCQGAIAEMKAERQALRQAIRQACAGDAATLCSTSLGEQKAVMQCLRQRQSEASAECRTQMAKLPARPGRGREASAAGGDQPPSGEAPSGAPAGDRSGVADADADEATNGE